MQSIEERQKDCHDKIEACEKRASGPVVRSLQIQAVYCVVEQITSFHVAPVHSANKIKPQQLLGS